MRDNHLFFRFDHLNDILIGAGRIVYEPAYEAWALPGGAKTKDREKAEDMARMINEITIRQQEALRAAAKRVLK